MYIKVFFVNITKMVCRYIILSYIVVFSVKCSLIFIIVKIKKFLKIRSGRGCTITNNLKKFCLLLLLSTLGTIQFLSKTFFFYLIISTIFTLKEKNRIFSREIFIPLTCDLARIKKHLVLFLSIF